MRTAAGCMPPTCCLRGSVLADEPSGLFASGAPTVAARSCNSWPTETPT
ncbi:hypothetical protein ACWF2L_21370 [Streptomyces anulatus]